MSAAALILLCKAIRTSVIGGMGGIGYGAQGQWFSLVLRLHLSECAPLSAKHRYGISSDGNSPLREPVAVPAGSPSGEPDRFYRRWRSGMRRWRRRHGRAAAGAAGDSSFGDAEEWFGGAGEHDRI